MGMGGQGMRRDATRGPMPEGSRTKSHTGAGAARKEPGTSLARRVTHTRGCPCMRPLTRRGVVGVRSMTTQVRLALNHRSFPFSRIRHSVFRAFALSEYSMEYLSLRESVSIFNT